VPETQDAVMTAVRRPQPPWPAGLAGAAFGMGTQAALWLTASYLAMAFSILEAVLAITVILTALYAPDKYSIRAFKLLPWTARLSANAHNEENHVTSAA
jgi:hypothetical protein